MPTRHALPLQSYDNARKRHGNTTPATLFDDLPVSAFHRPAQDWGIYMTPAPSLLISGSAWFDGTLLFGPLQLTIGAGKWTCLLGPSGVGKTTLLRLVAGLDAVTRFDGHLNASDDLPLAGRTALMAQSDLLMPWLNVTDNVLLGARLRGKTPDHARAARVLGRVGLSDHTRKTPDALSGGQRQRVALARTLMEDRPIVLLDEPFSALDARTRSQMQDLTVELLSGRTVLMVTHDPAEAARLADTILIMTETGISSFPPPPSPAPRAVDDGETLKTQGQLLALLRQTTQQDESV
ncbi:Aliphatic sulfonates import ATP-binding protein SsuB [Roseovarius litorisediminis]|uniref:Aliphatic sulfonates import ATP-binding protein SsuB n=2 Tax=Roseovarius litorisediminis TaxID=1312363 RepID=A0A1Y5RX69_9RHOB|nr:Aliphatic sulfonates import ATP-binding protein SsuB [Roseovarius litorisediminis]